jgi:hypothetical protein
LQVNAGISAIQTETVISTSFYVTNYVSPVISDSSIFVRWCYCRRLYPPIPLKQGVAPMFYGSNSEFIHHDIYNAMFMPQLDFCGYIKLPINELMPGPFDHRRTQWQLLPTAMTAESYTPIGTGVATWEMLLPKKRAWLDWDWVVLSGGVITLANPSDIRSNVALLDSLNRLLTLHDSAAMLAAIVQSLPWRDQVENLLTDCAL